ncbi:hypothetical protein LCGC14_1385890, partial [marine sediment metagenome]
IEFCLITSGILTDPDHGGWAKKMYKHLKTVIQQRAEITFENRTIVEATNIDVSGFLQGYDATPREAWQWLFGLMEHSNGWTEQTLTDAIDQAEFPRNLKPNDGEFSIDFAFSQSNGMKVFRNKFIAGNDIWVESEQFYFSDLEPILLDGTPDDIWLVSNGSGTMEIWCKPAFKWVKIVEFAAESTPPGQVFFQSTTPPNSTNSWWVDLTGLSIRRYNAQLNIWEPEPPITISSTEPVSPNDGDLWVQIVAGVMSLFEFDATKGFFVKRKFSKFPVQDPLTNTTFVGTFGNNNFIITCGDEALEGGPLGGGGALEIRKDGFTIELLATCLNFKGEDLLVSSGTGCVDIEHASFTTLTEQGSTPSTLADAGRIYTFDVGGITELFYIDNTGNTIQITNGGSTVQNVFVDITTTNATNNQTAFALPSEAKQVITMKINGVDTSSWTFLAPTLTYVPAGQNYSVKAGDEITILYYG